MRTEAEIRRKLRETETKQLWSGFWQFLVLDIELEILKWVLKEKPGRKK